MMPLAALCVLLSCAALPPRAVIVTTDCGAEVDDQWALAHLALSPEIALKGIVTTHAPSLAAPAAQTSAKTARFVLDRLGIKNPPPVVAGSDVPLNRDSAPRDNAGVRLLLDAAKGHTSDDRLVVVMIGAATDVASALKLDPTWADRVTIVAMAFSGWPDGDDPWNVKNDVRAWQIVMSSRAPLVVGDARVTRRRLLQTSESAHDRFGAKGPRGAFLVSILDGWLPEHSKMAQSVTGAPGAWPIWDEVVVAYLLGFTKQEERPRPVLKIDRSLDHSKPNGTITWITDIDGDRLWEDLAKKL